MRPISPFGGRREILILCPACQFQSSVPPAALKRNAYFCSSCGESIDLMSQSFRPPGEGGAGGPGAFQAGARRDKGSSRYKSARKGRR